jgi:hypothetical protein
MANYKKESALLAYKEDIEKAGVRDWVTSHTSFLKPLHKYRGYVVMQENSISFSGEEKDTNAPHLLTIPIGNITDVHHGFDDTYRRSDDRGIGLLNPLRITFKENTSKKIIYLWIGFRRLLRTSKNHQWFETLTSMIEK